MFRPFIDHRQENTDIEDGKLVLDLGYCVGLVERFVCTFSLIFKQSFKSLPESVVISFTSKSATSWMSSFDL